MHYKVQKIIVFIGYWMIYIQDLFMFLCKKNYNIRSLYILIV